MRASCCYAGCPRCPQADARLTYTSIYQHWRRWSTLLDIDAHGHVAGSEIAPEHHTSRTQNGRTQRSAGACEGAQCIGTM